MRSVKTAVAVLGVLVLTASLADARGGGMGGMGGGGGGGNARRAGKKGGAAQQRELEANAIRRDNLRRSRQSL